MRSTCMLTLNVNCKKTSTHDRIGYLYQKILKRIWIACTQKWTQYWIIACSYWIAYILYRLELKNYCACSKLRFTWGWAEVFSMAHIVQILNWAAWSELFSMSLLCVCIEGRGLRSASGDRLKRRTQNDKKLRLSVEWLPTCEINLVWRLMYMVLVYLCKIGALFDTQNPPTRYVK